jgi:NHLM bacteriocin system ABC transporter ATP-binding protein
MFIERPAATASTATGAIARGAFVLKIIEGQERGAEIVVEAGIATIGRAPDCTVVVTDLDVSRRHARIEATPDGFLVTDAGSSYGLWVGSNEVSSHLLQPGEPFRLAQSVVLKCEFIGTGADATVSDATLSDADSVSPDATRYVATASTPAPASGPNRAAPQIPEEAAPHVSEPQVWREPLRLASPPPVVDLPPAPVAKPAAPPPAVPAGTAGVTDADFSHTIVMPVPSGVLSTRKIDDEGELVELLAHKPLLLNDPEQVWIVVSGGVLIFTVAVENGQPVGPRTHFLGIVPGQCFCGFTTDSEDGSGFLAVAKQGTRVRRLSRSQLRALAADPSQRATIATMIDGWVGGLSRALTADMPLKRPGDVLLKPGERVELAQTAKASAADGVVWIELWSGSVVFDDLATPTFARRRVLFPITSDSWVQPVGDEFGAIAVDPLPTVDALTDAAAWQGLDAFHAALRESEFIKRKLATVDEYLRLEDKKLQSAAASKAGYDAIGSVLRTEAATPQEFRATTAAEAVYQACKIVGEALGIEVRQPPAAPDEELTFEERVAIIASNSGFRTRVVALRDTWWQHDHGPLLGQHAETKQPVALLQPAPTAYTVVGEGATPRPVTAAMAAKLSDFAYTLYRPFPEGRLGVSDLVTFGARNLAPDLRWVAAMAVIVGMSGTITPYLTGRVFDSAIPQADRGSLYGFGLALVASAIATSLFKLTQGVATNRIQSQMTARIASAVWDRMMNLPVNFFRKFSAGDLADRADGVDAIQDLVAGAGVSAILGSVSGVFFIGQMFGYNLRLAFLAIGLTAIFVGVNTAANYAQLRFQRTEIQLRGRITGIVLNLVTGVSKLRICGAEQHAFRVWAEQFAQQRRITFKVGTIQNIAAVFGSVYPVLCSIAIFWVVIGEQQRTAATREAALTTGEFIAFNAAFGLFMAAMQALGDASLSLLRVVPIYERLTPVLETAPEIDRSKAAPGKLTGGIELSHLHFRYDADGPFIVKDVSFKIKPGEFVAFVGASGCGKSTLMRLMLAFEQPSSGSIYFDGQDLQALDIRLVRQQMGVVMQQSRVMPTEIYRNIIGASSRSIEDAWEAAEKAGFAEDIRNMPMGMHTYVSEGGGTLSGGQRQRLMIARAIVNKPKILFLDEATSALDNRTQAIVTESMNRMEATRIVIAHRLSTIINANRICYLQGGQIIEMGSYQELMDKNGLFAELARRQMA